MMLTFRSVLSMRAAFVAVVAAAFGLLALANLSASPTSSAGKALSVRAPIISPVARDPLALVRRGPLM
jgi:hypothetical protein